MEKCCSNSQSSNSCIKIVKMLNEAIPKKCCKSRSNSSVKFLDIDSIKIHNKACMERCGDHKSSTSCKCAKIQIKKMHSQTCMDKCGDRQSSSIKCRKIRNNSREKCGDSQTESCCSSGTSLSVRSKVSFTSDTSSKTSNSKCSNSKSSKSTISSSSNSSTDIKNSEETLKEKVNYLPNEVKSEEQDTTENPCSHVPSKLDTTFDDKLDQTLWFRCPQCGREFTYCPYDIDDNCCFECPKCCKEVKYFNGPCYMDIDLTDDPCAKTKICAKKTKLQNNEECKKRKIYCEFLDFCRQKCYQPEMLECILLSSACINSQSNDDYKDLEKNCGTCDGVPFSKQIPPHTGYCMYGSKLDDWFTHYLMRYLTRAESEDECKATAWLNKIHEIIKEKYMLDGKEEHTSKRIARNRMICRLSKLYNSTVGPTPSEMNFYNKQKSSSQNLYDNQTKS